MTQQPPDHSNAGTITLQHDEKRLHVHLRGVFGDDAENEGVLSVNAVLDATENHPSSCLIIVGSPTASPLIDGYIPYLGGFTCGIEGAERLIGALQAAVAGVRAGLAASKAAT